MILFFLKEFMLATDMTASGSPEEKLRWAFKMYDKVDQRTWWWGWWKWCAKNDCPEDYSIFLFQFWWWTKHWCKLCFDTSITSLIVRILFRTILERSRWPSLSRSLGLSTRWRWSPAWKSDSMVRQNFCRAWTRSLPLRGRRRSSSSWTRMGTGNSMRRSSAGFVLLWWDEEDGEDGDEEGRTPLKVED